MIPPNNTRVLVLNADYSPIQLIGWEEAFKKVFKETKCPNCEKGFSGKSVCVFCRGSCKVPSADVVAEYEMCVRDGRGRMHPVPSVIRNARQVKVNRTKVPFSRSNIFRRDKYTCQYCGKSPQTDPNIRLEMEHVVPKSRWNGSGTPTCWSNIVTACRECNRKKDDYFLSHSKDHAANSTIHVYMPLRKKVGDQLVEYRKPKAPRMDNFQLTLEFLAYKSIPESWLPYVDHIL